MYEKLTEFLSKLQELEQLCMIKAGEFYCGPQAERFCAEYEQGSGEVLTSSIAALHSDCETFLQDLAGYRYIEEITAHYNRVIARSLYWLLEVYPEAAPAEQQFRRPDVHRIRQWFGEYVRTLRAHDLHAQWERARTYTLQRLEEMKKRHGH